MFSFLKGGKMPQDSGAVAALAAAGRQERMLNFRSGAMPEVHGWLGHKAVDALELVSTYQSRNGIRGDALEVGVFQGAFFLALMAACEPGEVALAIDIFDDQELNIDQSGAGSETYRIFMKNIQKFSDRPESLRVFQSDSMVLRSEQLLSYSESNGFRIISVDGGHTAEHVMNDLSLASQCIVSGGAIFLDDIHSPHWPGVYEGYVRYMMHANRSLAPVLYTANKLVLTTIGHAPRMVQFMREHFEPGDGHYMADVSSFGFKYIASD